MKAVMSRYSILLIFPVLDALLNIINYSYHFFLARGLTSQDYGLLNAYLALLGLLLIIGSAVQWIVTRNLGQQIATDYRYIERIILLVAMGLSSVLFILIPYILPLSRINLFLLAVTVFFHILVSFRRGVLQANERFYALTLSYYVEAIVKVGVTWIFLEQLDITLALIGILIGMILTYGLSIWQTHFPETAGDKQFHGLFQLIHVQIVMTLFFSVDSLLVTLFFPSLVGDYSVSLRFSQLVLFVCLSIFQVLLPRLSRAAETDSFLSFERTVFRLLLAALGIITVLYFLIIPSVVPIFFGQGYDEAGYFVRYMIFTYIGIIIVQYEAMLQFILRNNRYLRWYWALLFVFLVALFLFRQSMEMWLLAQAVVLLGGSLLLRFRFHSERRQQLKEES